ncbi:MAG: hypothetical protein P8K79_09455, partial [Mariniblastus sp.]|nr:hypothetical protein [Mariniblastus sp.]
MAGIAPLLIALFFFHTCLVYSQVNEVPESIRSSLDLDTFYQKHIDVGGLPVVGSERVSDAAMLE